MWSVTIFFYIVLVLSIIGIAWAIKYAIKTKKEGHIVYAGKIGNRFSKKFPISFSGAHFFKNGQPVNIAEFDFFKVAGSSMSTKGISNGDGIFAERISPEKVRKWNKPGIKIILKCDYSVANSPYTLHNFLIYVPAGKFKDSLAKLKEQINGNTQFSQADIEELEQSPIQDNAEYLITAMRIDKSQRNHLSLHKLNSVYGRVRYLVPAKDCDKILVK